MGDEVMYHGESGLIYKHSSEIMQDIYGEQRASAVFTVPPGRWDIMPGAGFSHPDVGHLIFEKRKVVMSPGFWEVSVDFTGVLEGNADRQYELNAGSGTEPIEVHPDFVSKVAGKPSEPLNGAIFKDDQGNVTSDDDLGEFDRFKITSDLKGVSGYLDMTNITWTETWVSQTVPSDGGEVKIDTPPGGAPSFGDKKWLYIGMSSSGVRGGTTKNKKTWRLGDWKEIMYPA